MIVLAPVHLHQWDECERRKMPSLLRFLAVVALLVATVYGGLFALAYFGKPHSREITVSVPPNKFYKDH